MNINFRQLTLSTALALTFGLPASSHYSIGRFDTDNISVMRKDSTDHKDSIAKEKSADKAKKDTTAAKKTNAYDKLVKKGGSVRNGLFTVRHIEDKWYFEVPQSITDRMLLAVTRFTSVPQAFKELPGEEVNHSTIYFEKRDDKTLLLRAYAKTQVADAKEQMAQLVEKSTADPIVAGLSSSDRKIVNVTALQADRSFVDTMTVYPINVEVKTLRTYSCPDGKMPASKTGFVTIGMNTSIVLLPEKPMQPRIADERVGFFETRQTRFSDGAPSKGYAIINRYRLEPKDPKAYQQGKLVEPKKQIVYYIDPATPKKWVPYLIAGINDWNAAFEAAGFKNAIVAREVPKGSSISPDDAQYCFLRYLPSETENAYGPRIVDPRSGEIIESHICWYHNVMNLVRKWYITQCGPLDKRAQTMQLPDKLMGELIRFVSSHEVGHTLGLRHNMIASSATPVEKLRDKKWGVGARTVPTHQCLRQVGHQMGLPVSSGIQGSVERSQAAAHGSQRGAPSRPSSGLLW